MRKRLLAIVALSLIPASGYAIDYTWIGASGASWTVATNWDNGSGSSRTYPNSAADTVTFSNGNFAVATGFTLTVGQYLVYGAGGGLNSHTGGQFICSNSGGKSGDYFKNNSTYGDFNSGAVNFDVFGNFMSKDSYLVGHYSYPLLKMEGNNKGWYCNDLGYLNMEIVGQGIWDNATAYGGGSTVGRTVTVDHGGSIGGAPTKVIDSSLKNGNWVSNSIWTIRRLILTDGQANLPAFGANASFCFTAATADNGTRNLVVNGGLTYPQDVFITQCGIAAKTPYTWRMKGGDLKCQDLQLGLYSTTYDGGGMYVLDTVENGTTNTFRNLTTTNMLIVGFKNYAPPTRVAEQFLLRLNKSTVTVGGALMVSDASASSQGAIDMGNSTINLGGDLKVYLPPTQWCVDNWKPGLSTIICNGNGTNTTQNINSWGDCGIKLNNLVVNTKGTVQLAAVNFAGTGRGGDLLLGGNLDIENGTWKGNAQNITFNGPSHVLTNKVGGAMDDNINLLAGSILGLGSSITIKTGDNLNMGSGSVIFLCGFTLTADGKTYNGALTGTSWNNDGGTIFALSNVPEPATLLLLGSGLMGAIGWARRRRMA